MCVCICAGWFFDSGQVYAVPQKPTFSTSLRQLATITLITTVSQVSTLLNPVRKLGSTCLGKVMAAINATVYSVPSGWCFSVWHSQCNQDKCQPCQGSARTSPACPFFQLRRVFYIHSYKHIDLTSFSTSSKGVEFRLVWPLD